ncbi:MAG: type II toxin-antitoxin system RelE/ParE family toxin [Ferruginibacter sp.]|nr:type II toxin-antitoxin system RelE/ParE family toxin [Ferruginibacter sp.]
MENVDIIALPQFTKEILQLSKKYASLEKDFENLLSELKNNPFSGNSLGHNCYKVRMKISAKQSGKSGEARVITCVKIIERRIFLVSIYDKAERETITKKEIESILKLSGTYNETKN